MKKIALLVFAIGLVKMQSAQSITWATNIAPVLYNNCTTCHHTDGIAPFPLISYLDAYQQRYGISSDITIRKMPPWPPDATYTRLAHERLLSQSDIDLINTWVNQGAPSGDTTLAPPAPVYVNGSVIGTSNLTLTIPTYTVPANQTSDIYQCFAIPTNLLQDMYITEMEVVPGNPTIVHHVLVYQDTTASHQAAALDAASPGPGYVNFGGIGVNSSILVGGWVPGTLPEPLPANFGIKLYKNSYLVLQIHYPAGGNGKSDSTKINIKLASSVTRQVSLAPILNHYTDLVNGPLHIPANTLDTFEEHYRLPAVDVSVLSVAPHCHLIGTSWLSYAVTTQNDTIPFIRIDNWNFHWQGFYQFRNILKVPKNSDLYAFATYDNTGNNPNNPNTPPQDVVLGESTTNEMMLVYFSYTLYQPGDENIVLDTAALVDITDTTSFVTGVNEASKPVVSTPQLYDAVPNPASDQTRISYFLPATSKVELKIYDLSGRLVDEVNATNLIGFNNINYNTSKLQPATYLVSLLANGMVKTKQLVVTK